MPHERPKLQMAGSAAQEMLPLSLLNDYLYCPRRAGLKIIEGWRAENEHTVRGDIVHEHADLPGYEAAKGVTLLRALPVFSERLGLSGKCDVVEVHPDRACGHPLPSDGRGVGSFVPVEYKKSKRRQFENDDAQLCAQALCLEEMFRVAVPRGAVFHAESKRRRDVIFTPELRSLTEQAIGELRGLMEAEQAAPARFKPACEECSLFNICLPRITSQSAALGRAAAQLFET